MSASTPKVSVIIATYQPGEGLNRVIDSIDGQTLPQDEFEVVFVDDGSPDDTHQRLQRLAADRENFRVFRIENSGWPSKPRNLGIAEARGEYVLFMDHDDSLFPDGLRRAYEYAVETGADMLSPKESKTNDLWWGMSSLGDGNLDNVLGAGGIHKILPMVPHKMYRRQLLLDHDLTFPEGARVLWEDIFINVGAYRHAKVVSVLADTPVYLWHASDTNSSHTFNPARRDFWDRLEDVMVYIDKTLDTPELADDHAVALAHQLQVRVIDRMVRYVQRSYDPSMNDVQRVARHLRRPFRNRARLRRELARLRAFHRARGLLRRFGPPEVLAKLPAKHRIQAELLRQGRRDLMIEVRSWDTTAGPVARATSMAWRDGVLVLEIEAAWGALEGEEPVLRREGDRVLLAVPENVRAAVPEELLDATALLGSEFEVTMIARDRYEDVSWTVPISDLAPRFVDSDDGAVRIVATATATLDIAQMAGGRPLRESVWDVRIRTSWCGMSRRRGLRYDGPARAALTDARPVVAYGNNDASISLDLTGQLRTFATDAAPVAGTAGSTGGFSVRLGNAVSDRDSAVPIAALAAVPEAALGASTNDLPSERLDDLATPIVAKAVADGGTVRLVGSVAVDRGRYRVFARRKGRLRTTRHVIDVAPDGRLEWIVEDE